MKTISTSLILLSCLLMACGSGKSQGTPQPERIAKDTISTFILPEIPVMLDTPELRAEYLVQHYWDNLNFADTNYIHHPEVTEQAWVNYIDLMNYVSAQTADANLKKVFAQAEVEEKSYRYLMEMADKYLYDPNSPIRNEELYISVLDAILSSPILNDTEKIRPKARRDLAQKNRIGTKALNFTYTLASGKQGNLYALNSPYTLLFINNPGCHACAETIDALKSAPAIGGAFSRKQLQILSVYPDEELDEWRKHLPDFPSQWINGYDAKQTIKEKNLYDLKAIPTLYLLDKDKTVLLKDATVEAIDNYLSRRE